MTRPQRKGTRLTNGQLDELCSAMYLMLEDRSAFASDDDRRRVWIENREEVRRHYQRKYCRPEFVNWGPEPLAWRCYDAPPEDRATFPDVPFSND